MSRYAHEEHTRVWWVPGADGIADIAAPTVDEIEAGTDLSPFIKKEGVKVGATQNNVNNATIETAYDAENVGSWKTTPELTMFRDAVSGDDDAWTLCVYGAVGFIVVRRGTTNITAVAAAQRVEVYPAQMHQPIMMDTAANENAAFVEKFATTSTPNLKAVVAA